MMGEHTPGPWEVDSQTAKKFSVRIRAPRIGTRSNPNPAVATIHTPRSWSEGEANAALVAAAPELLAALEALTPLAENNTDDTEKWQRAISAAKAAIAKAKGSSE